MSTLVADDVEVAVVINMRDPDAALGFIMLYCIKEGTTVLPSEISSEDVMGSIEAPWRSLRPRVRSASAERLKVGSILICHDMVMLGFVVVQLAYIYHLQRQRSKGMSIGNWKQPDLL